MSQPEELFHSQIRSAGLPEPFREWQFDAERKFRAIFGGGRYDNLIEKFGGPPTPATGISLGIGRLIDVVIARGLGATLAPRLDVFLAPITQSMVRYAVKLETQLVGSGLSCELDLMERNLKKLLEIADSKRARYVVIVGERDLKKGEVSVRDMETKETSQVKMEQLSKHIQASKKK